MSIPYFYPAQPSRIWPNSNIFAALAFKKDWDAELKYNGWRLLIFKDDNSYRFYNRHGTLISATTDVFHELLDKVPNGTVFDAELVDKRTKELKSIIVIFDCPFYAGKDLRNQPLIERRKNIDFKSAPRILKNGKPQIYKIKQYTKNITDLYWSIDKENNPLLEGLVLKDVNSKYHWHPSRKKEIVCWQKVKKVGDHAHTNR